MKLRNRKTGEIREIKEILIDKMFTVNSLAKLNEEWEDYTEKDIKHYYCISTTGDVHELVYYGELTQAAKDKMAIGNYFSTRKEAEKAVERLKAFKRLQELGFRFEGIRFRNNHNYIEWKLEPKNELTDHETGELLEGLYKVFGGSDDN